MGDAPPEGIGLIDERQARYLAQTTEQYASLGRFVQAFEQMVDAARAGCVHLFPVSGPFQVQQRMLHLLLSSPGMTAKPVFDALKAFLGELMSEMGDAIPADERKVIGDVLSYIDGEVQHLMQARNALLHGTWYIGWANEADQDFSEFLVHKWKASSRGLESHDLPKTAMELDALSARCDALTELVRRVWVAFRHGGSGGPGPRVRFNVHRRGKVWLPSPPPP